MSKPQTLEETLEISQRLSRGTTELIDGGSIEDDQDADHTFQKMKDHAKQDILEAIERVIIGPDEPTHYTPRGVRSAFETTELQARRDLRQEQRTKLRNL